ncbi:MAG: hypothetical protein EBV03_02075 [Proteobacteria bacterium]|nr:hypothetical protein [Pseudomonadota bacterium]
MPADASGPVGASTQDDRPGRQLASTDVFDVFGRAVKPTTVAPDKFRFEDGFPNFTAMLDYLAQQDPSLPSRNAMFRLARVSEKTRKQLDMAIQHITDQMGPIKVASMGEEAIVLGFGLKEYVLRITPKRNMLDEILNNTTVIDEAIKHYSVCLGENNDVVLSAVPRLTGCVKDSKHLETVYRRIREKHFDDAKGGILFTDVKHENMGELPDGTPVVTDLGGLRRIRVNEAFEQMERQLESHLDNVNKGRATDPKLEWFTERNGQRIHKQDFYYGDPAQSRLGHVLAEAVKKVHESGLGPTGGGRKAP